MIAKKETLLIAALCLLTAPVVHAATFTVTKVQDTRDGNCDQDCSLREAIEAANTVSGEDTVTIPANSYQIQLTGGSENNNKSGDLDIRDDLILQGAGATVTGSKRDRVFHVLENVKVTITGLTIRDGNAVTPPFPHGGGIWNLGNLSLQDVVLSNNVAQGGGGITNEGTLLIQNSSITNNTTQGNGGGIEQLQGSVETYGTKLINNQATVGGGIFYAEGKISLKQTLLQGNSATDYAGGIFSGATFDSGIDETTIMGNEAPVGKDCVGTLILTSGKNTIGDTKGCGLQEKTVQIPQVLLPNTGWQGEGIPTQKEKRSHEKAVPAKKKQEIIRENYGR